MKEIILIAGSTSKKARESVKEIYQMPPVGLLALSSFLKTHGYKVKICDLVIEDYSLREFGDYLRSLSEEPIMVGVQVYTEAEKECLNIASIIKNTFSNTKVVLGGPHASFEPNRLISNENVDFVLLGEGESKIIPLLEHIKNPNNFPPQNVPGLVYKKTDNSEQEICITNNALPITNLDLLPFPDYHEWKMSEIHLSKMFSFVTSRGCPSNCIFCSSKALSGSKYRFYSSEWVYSMIVHFYKIYKFSHMAFLDDTLLANGLRARRICKYLKFFSVEKGFGWACKSRADMINEDIVRELRESGCAAIHVGVENINQAVLDKMGKGVKIDDIYNAIMLTNKYEMRLDCSFIIGLPGETLKTIEDTLLFSDVVDKEGYGTPAIGIATPFPGTALLNNAEKYGITIKEKNYQKYDLGTPIFELEGVKLNDLRKAHFYFHHQRFTSINPGLTGRTDDEIKEVREEFLKRLKGGLDVES